MLLTALSASLVIAMEAPPASADPVLEKRVNAISEELRCLVCQNQTVADSHAELAIDLKNQVRAMLVAGKSEADIKAYMVERYGDFVLYRPPVKSSTWVLWVGPFLLLIGGLSFLIFKLRQRAKKVKAIEDALSPEEARRVSELLAQGTRSSSSESKKP